MKILKKILDVALFGNWLSKVLRNLPYLFLLICLIILVNINRYRVEELIGEKKNLQERLDELHAENIHIRSNLMSWGTESKILADSSIINLGMKLPHKPHITIK
ncbi:MAG: hypothetical protein CSB06_01390 [Bacteroidia bacterium]|nr:MAG: hypothetical protein CSB06_01390 [Bacteroidia bacterium]